MAGRTIITLLFAFTMPCCLTFLNKTLLVRVYIRLRMTKEPCTIFYTDDDDDDRFTFSDALRHVTDECQLALQRNGDELLNMLKNPSPRPSLVFLDLNMPVKNGYTVLKEIREKESLDDLPVVIFSTSDDDVSINTSKELGANLYMPKPSTFAALKTAIRHALSINWKDFSPSPETFVFNAANHPDA